MSSWQAVIGLEIHAQLLTKSKLFSPDPAHFAKEENAHIHPVSTGLPGVLPSLNFKAIEYGVLAGLALHCEINRRSLFARKHYFYPDLPKGYQISQSDEPLCRNGSIEFYLDGEKKRIRIQRVHLEEDAGRFHHKGKFSLINFNRAGVPLVEIVSEPDIRSPKEAAEALRSVRKLLMYLNITGGNLELGSMRCDCNVSIRRKGDSKLGVRAELKNLNSFRFVEKALDYEIKRQMHTLDTGETIKQETRLYDSAKNKTFAMRSKEESSDYRYLPDPNLRPVLLKEEWIKEQKQNLPESFLEKIERFQKEYQTPYSIAYLVTEDQDLADYLEQLIKMSGNIKLSQNWLINEVLARLNESNQTIKQSPVSAKMLAEMVAMIDKKEISGKMAKDIFASMWKTKESAKSIFTRLGMKRITDAGELKPVVEKVIKNFPAQVESFRSGKEKLFGFFVGQIMRETKGQADPTVLNELLREELKK